MPLLKISSKDLRQENAWINDVETFKELTDRQLKYIYYGFDYHSPLRSLPIKDRLRQAALMAGYKMEKDGSRLDANARALVEGKVKSVEQAIVKYNSMQFDEDRETYESVCTLLRQLRELNNKPDKNVNELEKAVKMSKEIDKLTETKRKLEELLNIQPLTTSATQIAEDALDEAPFIETFIQNQLENNNEQ